MTDVLVIDDDVAIRRMVRTILECTGYAVCEAADGLFALEHLRAHPQAHVILLDREMPRLNGVRTLEVLACQSMVRTQQMTIMMTASTEALPPAFAHIPVLSKPFNIEDLLAMVDCAAHRLATPSSQY